MGQQARRSRIPTSGAAGCGITLPFSHPSSIKGHAFSKARLTDDEDTSLQ